MRIEPGTRCTVSEWHPHYAGLTAAVGDLFDERNAIVRIEECPIYPNGSWAILAISELEEQP
jgi:hypothetical protein